MCKYHRNYLCNYSVFTWSKIRAARVREKFKQNGMREYGKFKTTPTEEERKKSIWTNRECRTMVILT